MLNARERFHQQIKEALAEKTDIERSKAPLLHDSWRVGRECAAGDVLRYDGRLYRCLIAHTAQADWVPDVAPSLWTQIMYRDGYRIIPEMIESTQAFAIGELGWWGDALYTSLIDGNVWTPEAYPAGWKLTE